MKEMLMTTKLLVTFHPLAESVRHVAVALAIGLPLVASSSVGAQGNPYRKIVGETGNIIFSTQPLPRGKESTFRDVRTAFKNREEINARAYFAGPIRNFVKKGTVYNSLREGTYFSEVTIYERTKTNPTYYSSARHAGRDVDMSVTGQMWEFGKTLARCDWRSHMSKGRCLDLEWEAGNAAHRFQKPLPYTIVVCVGSYYTWGDTDAEKREANKGARTPASRKAYLAQGCFEYTGHMSIVNRRR